MTAHTHEAIKQQVKKYWLVFAALVVGTIVTVALAEVHIAMITVAILLALAVALVKGTLVAGYFMHLFEEKKLIYWVLGLTAFFVVVMFALILFTYADHTRTGPGVFDLPPRQADHGQGRASH